MRKTLTAVVVLLAAGSLAACKMPWDKAESPTTAVATSDTPTPDTTASLEPAKPAQQTASVDPGKPSMPEAPPTAPAAK